MANKVKPRAQNKDSSIRLFICGNNYVLGAALSTLLCEWCPMLRKWVLLWSCGNRWHTERLRVGPSVIQLGTVAGLGPGLKDQAVEPMSLTILLDCLSDHFVLLLPCALFCTALYIVVMWYFIIFFYLMRSVRVFFISFLTWIKAHESFSYILHIKNLFFHHLNSRIDVAIGAPQEDDLRGAIYIYNGRADGISSVFSQVGDNSIFKRSIGKKKKNQIFWGTSYTAQKILDTFFVKEMMKEYSAFITNIYHYENMLALP